MLPAVFSASATTARVVSREPLSTTIISKFEAGKDCVANERNASSSRSARFRVGRMTDNTLFPFICGYGQNDYPKATLASSGRASDNLPGSTRTEYIFGRICG